jgi:hypothetical protein
MALLHQRSVDLVVCKSGDRRSGIWRSGDHQIWRSGDLEIWRSLGMGIWKSRDMEIRRSGGPGIWRPGYMGSGVWGSGVRGDIWGSNRSGDPRWDWLRYQDDLEIWRSGNLGVGGSGDLGSTKGLAPPPGRSEDLGYGDPPRGRLHHQGDLEIWRSTNGLAPTPRRSGDL